MAFRSSDWLLRFVGHYFVSYSDTSWYSSCFTFSEDFELFWFNGELSYSFEFILFEGFLWERRWRFCPPMVESGYEDMTEIS